MIAVPRPWRGGESVGSPLVVLAAWLCGGLLLTFILLPLLQLVPVQTAGTLLEAVRATDVRSALTLSVVASVLTAVVAGLFGVPFAYFLARADFVGKSAVAAIVDVPLTVPHTVAGIALLMVFGRHGVIGGPAEDLLGLRFWGTLAGIVVAMLFVSLPYTVNAARIAFEGVDPRLEMVARTLGMGPWRMLARITVPLAWRGIATGLTLTRFTPNTWHHIVAEYHNDTTNHLVIHDALTVDGVRMPVNITHNAFLSAGSRNQFTNAVQLDSNSVPAPYSVYVDNMKITYQ